MDVIDNIIPYIPKEEEKVERETKKILGKLSGDAIAYAGFGKPLLSLDSALPCHPRRLSSRGSASAAN